jgi:hypothetical protein
MAIQKEIWLSSIEDNLFKGFELLQQAATNDSAFVNNKTVHVPNAAAAPTVSRGNTTYPVAVSERNDTDLTYNLTNFEIGPVRLGWADGLQLSYDKVASVTNDFMGNLSENMKNWAISQWWTHNGGDVDRLVSTTGTATTTNWLGGSATGALKQLLGADVRNAAKILDKEKFPVTDRYLLLDYEMFWQLLGDVSYNANRIEVVAGLPATIDNIHGFKVIQLPYVLALSANTGTLTTIAPNAADGSFTFSSTSRPAGLAFHKSAVSFAWTDPYIMTNDNDATMFGDVMSATVYGGGKHRRIDGKGVVAIRATA